MRFDDMVWHDAVLLSLSVDRSRPGVHDEVALEILDPEDRCFDLRFTDCYEAHFFLNFGVIAEETIRDATRTTESESLDRLRSEWGRGGVDLSDVEQFEIETNSTGSVIRILAKSCTVTAKSSSK